MKRLKGPRLIDFNDETDRWELYPNSDKPKAIPSREVRLKEIISPDPTIIHDDHSDTANEYWRRR